MHSLTQLALRIRVWLYMNKFELTITHLSWFDARPVVTVLPSVKGLATPDKKGPTSPGIGSSTRPGKSGKKVLTSITMSMKDIDLDE